MNYHPKHKSNSRTAVWIGAGVLAAVAIGAIIFIIVTLRSPMAKEEARAKAGIVYDSSATEGGWDNLSPEEIEARLNEKVAEGMGPGSHGSTFGGNPVVCAGANVVVDRMDTSFLANVNDRAVQLRAGIAKLPHVKSISGIGLMVGIEFYDVAAADVLAACREKGLLVLTAKTRLRLLPPLTLTAHDVDMALEVLAEVLGAMEPTAPKEQA